ncbi:MAG: glycosyltransferase family 1 protein [Pyrinomonadaceae bacterium]
MNGTESHNEPVKFAAAPDLVCLSHLRWDFVYQRPQHLLSRFARGRRVFFVEEPIFDDDATPRLDVGRREDGLHVVVPRLPHGLDQQAAENAQSELLDQLFAEQRIGAHVMWYYTPMALGWTRRLPSRPLAIIYDCMDELSAFKNAPPILREREEELFALADLVFTGGQSLYESKRERHPRVYCFPSSIDAAHFGQARAAQDDPEDQANIPRPRLGFFGVVDERMDLALLDAVAGERPEWHFVVIGPVVKIDPAELPRRANIHYLGGKDYKELPRYLAGWDAALLPFARNESTRFISPTKTPEYLAAGRPVVSTSIRDVVRPYGEMNLVHIADAPAEFVAATERALAQRDDDEWLRAVDALLAQTSWDRTWDEMNELIDQVAEGRRAHSAAGEGGEKESPQRDSFTSTSVPGAA